MTKFEQLCRARNHCVACRTNDSFRKSLSVAGIVSAPEFDCPFSITAETAPAIQAEALAKLGGHSEDAAKRKAELEEKGRTAWLWLHENADTGTLTAERLKMEFEPMIPAYGCSCRREWKEILAKNPLRTEDQLLWSQEVHDAVNKKLGKPTYLH